MLYSLVPLYGQVVSEKMTWYRLRIRQFNNPNIRPPHIGVCGQIFVLTDFWQIRRIFAIVIMSETVGIDIHEIEGNYIYPNSCALKEQLNVNGEHAALNLFQPKWCMLHSDPRQIIKSHLQVYY